MPKRNWPALLKHIRAIITDISPTITWLTNKPILYNPYYSILQ